MEGGGGITKLWIEMEFRSFVGRRWGYYTNKVEKSSFPSLEGRRGYYTNKVEKSSFSSLGGRRGPKTNKEDKRRLRRLRGEIGGVPK